MPVLDNPVTVIEAHPDVDTKGKQHGRDGSLTSRHEMTSIGALAPFEPSLPRRAARSRSACGGALA